MTCTRSPEQRRLESLARRASRGDETALAPLMAHLRPLLTDYVRDRVPLGRDVDRLVEGIGEEVAAMLRTPRVRRTPFPAAAYALAARRVRPLPVRARAGRFTARERQILDQVREGRSNREIALALFLSESAVGVHVARLLRRVGGRGREALLGPVEVDAPAAGAPEEDEGTLDLAAAHAELRADVHATLTPPRPPAREGGNDDVVVAFDRPGDVPG